MLSYRELSIEEMDNMSIFYRKVLGKESEQVVTTDDVWLLVDLFELGEVFFRHSLKWGLLQVHPSLSLLNPEHVEYAQGHPSQRTSHEDSATCLLKRIFVLDQRLAAIV